MKPRAVGRSFATVALCVLSGALFALAMPSRDVSWLAWIAFLPLLAAARINSPLIAAGCGILAGASAAVVLGGPGMTGSQVGNLVGAFAGLAAALALTACIASLTKSLHPILWSVLVACAGVTGEVLSAYLFPINAALTQYELPGALRLASFTGIWGVSFLIWLLPASVVAVFTDRRRNWPVTVASVLLTCAVLIVPFGGESKGPRITVCAIQAPDCYNSAEETVSAPRGSEIIVWPEHVMDATSREPFEAARQGRVWVLASFEDPRNGSRPLNTARLISPRGRTSAVFQKTHLFGQENLSRAPGRSSKPVDRGGFKVGSAICFDAAFTDVCRDLARQGAAIILVPNSDPEMPRCLFHRVHRAFVAFRAAENGTPIVWAECYALSCVLDGRGRIVASAPANAISRVRAAVRLRSGLTFYTRAGDWFAYLCMVFTVVCAVLVPLSDRLRNRKPRDQRLLRAYPHVRPSQFEVLQ